MSDSKTENGIELRTKKNKRNPVLLFGIGLFAWIGIGTIAFLFERITKDIFLNIGGINPKYTFLIAELVDFSTYIIAIIIFVNIIKSKKFSELNIFKFSVLLLIIGQILQYLESYVNSRIPNENYQNNSKQYFDFLKENPEYYTINVAVSVLIWIIVALIIYLNKNNSG